MFLFIQSQNSTAEVIVNPNKLIKVCSNLLSYFTHKCHSTVLDPFFVQKNREIDFEENKFNEKIGECKGFFTSKDPITLSVI